MWMEVGGASKEVGGGWGLEYVSDLDFVYMRNQHNFFVTYDSLL